LGGSFFHSGAGRAAAADGPTGGDLPWAAAISATELFWCDFGASHQKSCKEDEKGKR